MRASECIKGHEWKSIASALEFFHYDEVTDENAQEISDYLKQVDPYDGDTITMTVHRKGGNIDLAVTTTTKDKLTPAIQKAQEGVDKIIAAVTTEKPFKVERQIIKRLYMIYYKDKPWMWFKQTLDWSSMKGFVGMLNEAYQKGFSVGTTELLNKKKVDN